MQWWNRDGLLVGMWGAPETATCIHEQVATPVRPATLTERWTDPPLRAAQNNHRLAR